MQRRQQGGLKKARPPAGLQSCTKLNFDELQDDWSSSILFSCPSFPLSLRVSTPPEAFIWLQTTLVYDADGDGKPDPGDKIRDVISYQNSGQVGAADGTVIDGYDETLVSVDEGQLSTPGGGV